MNFQDIILSLQKYWKEQGCLLLQPYDVEKGAGTFNPATFLRALGPKTWRAAYVEPSRRPADGRYGQNPNRLRRHYQYQVIIKPSYLLKVGKLSDFHSIQIHLPSQSPGSQGGRLPIVLHKSYVVMEEIDPQFFKAF